MGVLCAVAEGRINERDVYELITIPSFRTWDALSGQNKRIATAPACGLYFIGINYKPEEEWSLDARETTVRGTRCKTFFE